MARVAARPTDAERNVGHGHVWSRPDGRLARCGGPGVCRECNADSVQKAGQDWDRFRAVETALAEVHHAVAMLRSTAPVKREDLLRLLGSADKTLQEHLTVEEPPPPTPIENLYGFDERVHSRACGIIPHGHGGACHANCPTCGGRADFAAAPVNSAAKADGTTR